MSGVIGVIGFYPSISAIFLFLSLPTIQKISRFERFINARHTLTFA